MRRKLWLAMALSLATLLPGQGRAEPVVRVGGIGLELSGVGMVTDGVLVAEDELVGSVLVLEPRTLDAGNGPLVARLQKIDRSRKRSAPRTSLPRLFAVQDFEGIATDGLDTVYLIGSHAPKQAGRWHRRADREFIIKARWERDDGETALRVKKAKKRGVAGIYRRLADILPLARSDGAIAGLNIEGLALREDRLYIGLRAPLADGDPGKALVFSTGTRGLFGKKSRDFDPPLTRLELDLGGGGVRGMHWDADTERLLVLSGPTLDAGNAPRAIWSYDFDREALTLEHEFSDRELDSLGNPEGITRFDGDHLLIVFDADPDAGAPGPASMMLLAWP